MDQEPNKTSILKLILLIFYQFHISCIYITDKDNNYIEIKQDKDEIIIILSSQDSFNLRKMIVNSVVLSKDQFKELLKDITI